MVTASRGAHPSALRPCQPCAADEGRAAAKAGCESADVEHERSRFERRPAATATLDRRPRRPSHGVDPPRGRSPPRVIRTATIPCFIRTTQRVHERFQRFDLLRWCVASSSSSIPSSLWPGGHIGNTPSAATCCTGATFRLPGRDGRNGLCRKHGWCTSWYAARNLCHPAAGPKVRQG